MTRSSLDWVGPGMCALASCQIRRNKEGPQVMRSQKVTGLIGSTNPSEGSKDPSRIA